LYLPQEPVICGQENNSTSHESATINGDIFADQRMQGHQDAPDPVSTRREAIRVRRLPQIHIPTP